MSDNSHVTYITLTIPEKKRVALIAHDNKKQQIIDWCLRHGEILGCHELCGTGTTARLIAEKTGLKVERYRSGPWGGDQQVGAGIADGTIDLVIFFCDPLTAQSHDPDVKALLRLAQVYDIPIATNRSTADFLISSPWMEVPYEHQVQEFVESFKQKIISRAENPAD